MKRKAYKPKVGGKWNDQAMSQMREAAFGKDMCLHIYRTCDASEKMRNDASMLEAAQQKRDRKAAKRRST